MRFRNLQENSHVVYALEPTSLFIIFRNSLFFRLVKVWNNLNGVDILLLALFDTFCLFCRFVKVWNTWPQWNAYIAIWQLATFLWPKTTFWKLLTLVWPEMCRKKNIILNWEMVSCQSAGWRQNRYLGENDKMS